MSCFNPLIAVRDGYTPKGKNNYKILSNISNYVDVDLSKRVGEQDAILLPCGKCRGCRFDKSRRWADRMCLELDRNPDALFITVTYDPKHVFSFSDVFEDRDGVFHEESLLGLDKSDFVLFMKRLREYFSDKQLRFYMCGEYGSKSKRPHGHYILYGLTKEDLDCQFWKFNKLGHPMYISRLLERIWKKGFCVVADVSWNDMSYTARYVTKKLDGDIAPEYYRGRLPEFSLMSRNPGLGMYYMDDHPEVFDSDYIYMSVAGEPRKIFIPLEFYRRLEKIDLDRYNEVKKDFNSFPRMYLEAQRTDLSIPDYFAMRYQQFLDHTKVLNEENIEVHNLY